VSVCVRFFALARARGTPAFGWGTARTRPRNCRNFFSKVIVYSVSSVNISYCQVAVVLVLIGQMLLLFLYFISSSSLVYSYIFVFVCVHVLMLYLVNPAFLLSNILVNSF